MKQPIAPTRCKSKTNCRLRYGSTICFPIGWTPEYDGNGKLLNSDPSTYSTNVSCRTCGGTWYRNERAGKTTWRIVTEKEQYDGVRRYVDSLMS